MRRAETRDNHTGVDMLRLTESIEVEAPIWRVYEAWAHPERFADFNPQIVRVEKQSRGFYLFYVEGPEDEVIPWDAVITEDSPNKRIAWESTFPGLFRTDEILLQAFRPLRTLITYTVALGAASESPHRPWVEAWCGHHGRHRLRACLSNFRQIIEAETRLISKEL